MKDETRTTFEVSSALARGVRQLVLIGSGKLADKELDAPPLSPLSVFAVDEQPSLPFPATFVETHFDQEPLATALERSSFDRLKATLFIWVGATYRTADAALATLAFIASLPKGSGVLFDYVPERTSSEAFTSTALDSLASRFSCAGGAVKHLIQPQALTAMLRGLGFNQMTDYFEEKICGNGERIVTALV